MATCLDRIETPRLLLRKFRTEDVEDVHRNWASDPLVQLMYGEPVYETLDAVEGLLQGYISNYEKPNYHRFAIILKGNNQCIGQIAFYLFDANNNFAEIEYCVGRAFQGNGYVPEATKALIQFGFEQLNLHKIQISHKRTNEKSKRVIEKCGFHYDATFRDYFLIDGEYVDRIYYSILQDEYLKEVAL